VIARKASAYSGYVGPL